LKDFLEPHRQDFLELLSLHQHQLLLREVLVVFSFLYHLEKMFYILQLHHHLNFLLQIHHQQ
jgi:hypothetical protein